MIVGYQRFLQSEKQPCPTFVPELTELNRRRNRVLHELWQKGYTATNTKLEPACLAAFSVYGLLIEWLQTFDSQIMDFGFDYE